MKASILVVEDEEDMRNGLCRMLSKEGYNVEGVGTGDEAIRRLEHGAFDTVITDLKLPGPDGMEVLKKLKEVSPESQGIVITGYSTVESAVEAMRLGAYDYISKPFDLGKIKVVVRNALQQSHLIKQNKCLKQKIDTQWQVEHIIGKSDAMQEVIGAAKKVAPADTNVLVLGESGTGKELVSRLIHRLSARRDSLFMPVNCAVLREAFLESELFGYAKGAFTGAVSAKRGLLEVANGGTFFLDEIADVSLAVQAKLLRVLEERCFMRLGGTETLHVDIRLVAATNKDLEACVREGSFREDLYYRLNVFQIRLPPLRERREDIPLLAYHFLEKHGRRLGKSISEITPEALQALTYYDWRGNVRELENTIEGGVILADGKALTSRDLPIRIAAGEPEQALAPAAVSYSEAKRKLIDRFNKMFVHRLLARNNNNVTHAAEEAGMNRANFQRLMRSAGVKPGD
jgi:DNA-binding NtrC family response regulator